MYSPIYRHPFLYSLTMRALYGRGFEERYRALDALVPDGATVFEACAGDCRLYENYLKPRGISYRGSDLNPTFVAHARRRGIAMDLLDLRKDPLPKADVVILQASLYQFIPNEREIVRVLAAAARKTLIVAEPVRNMASSSNPVVAWIGKRAAGTGDASHPSRFTETSLTELLRSEFGRRITHEELIANGREKVLCIAAE